jgi:hypothetical protein
VTLPLSYSRSPSQILRLSATLKTQSFGCRLALTSLAHACKTPQVTPALAFTPTATFRRCYPNRAASRAGDKPKSAAQTSQSLPSRSTGLFGPTTFAMRAVRELRKSSWLLQIATQSTSRSSDSFANHQIQSWCTGEDSNLRSSLGAADLQSAAINHSATCANLTPSHHPV